MHSSIQNHIPFFISHSPTGIGFNKHYTVHNHRNHIFPTRLHHHISFFVDYSILTFCIREDSQPVVIRICHFSLLEFKNSFSVSVYQFQWATLGCHPCYTFTEGSRIAINLFVNRLSFLINEHPSGIRLINSRISIIKH